MIQLVFNEARCKGCGFCVEFCPKKIVALSEGRNNLGYNFATTSEEEKCTGCALCAMMCPEVLIEVREVK